METDYYSILGVPRDATPRAIKKAFWTLALKHHPDKDHSPGAHERFIRIQQAYLILADEESRSKYDQETTRVRSSPLATEPSGISDSHQGFEDPDLSAWAQNARRQAEQLAGLSFALFAKSIGAVAKEAGTQGATAIVYAFSYVFAGLALFGLVSGLYHGDLSQVLLCTLIGTCAAFGLGFAEKRYGA